MFIILNQMSFLTAIRLMSFALAFHDAEEGNILR